MPPHAPFPGWPARALEEVFYLLSHYRDVPEVSKFLRSPSALWQQIRAGNVEDTARKILDFGAAESTFPTKPPVKTTAPLIACKSFIS